jgi:hypothetical protein
MVAARQTSSRRVEANRRNSQKSTGPRTPAGKRRSRLNAIKHGLCARIPVLPGEDADAFRCRVDGFMDALQPRDDVELFLAEQAALAAWRAQRADRAEAAHLAAILRAARVGAESGRCEEVAALGRWLLASRVREKQDAAKSLLPFLDGDRQLAFRTGDGEPMHVVVRLEASTDGCRWLLGRWAELRAPLERDQDWGLDELVRAIQLLGQRPMDLDAFDWGNLLDRTGVGDRAGLCRTLLRQLDDGAPEDGAGRRAALLRVVERATARLEGRAAAQAQREAADLEELADRLAFDTTSSGERMRRYHLDCDRTVHRAINSLLKLRRAEAAAIRMAGGGQEEPAGELGAPTAVAADPPSSEIAPTCGCAAEPDRDSAAPNEPMPPAVDLRIPRNEATPAANGAWVPRNEATPPAVDARIARNEANADPRSALERSPSVAMPAEEHPADDRPDRAETVHHPLGTDQEPGGTRHEADDPGPVEGERLVRPGVDVPEGDEPDQAHGQEGGDEPHQRRDESISDRELRFNGPASHQESSSIFDAAAEIPIVPGLYFNRPCGANQPRRLPHPAAIHRPPLRDNSGWPVRFHSEMSYNRDSAGASHDGRMPSTSSGSSFRSARTGESLAEGAIMDSNELFSQFSINRLDGEPVPEDLEILLPHRDELAARSGVRLVLDEDWHPWTDPTGLTEAIRSDPAAAAGIRASAEVSRLCAFIAEDGARRYLGFWRGPSHRKIPGCPIVIFDDAGEFHLFASQSFAEAVLEYNYAQPRFDDLRAWLQSLGIPITWDSPSQLTLPHEKCPPRELHRQLLEQYRRSLLSHQ